MTRLLFIVSLFACGTVYAGQVHDASVDYKDGVYSLKLDVEIEGDFEAVRAIVTDYDNLEQLNDTFIESTMISTPDNSLKRRRIIASSCFLIFCFKIKIVEDVEEIGREIIVTTMIPEQSDFKSGKATWQVSPIGADRSRIQFYGEEEPSFWIPPIIGPLLVKRKIMKEALETIHQIELLSKDV